MGEKNPKRKELIYATYNTILYCSTTNLTKPTELVLLQHKP